MATQSENQDRGMENDHMASSYYDRHAARRQRLAARRAARGARTESAWVGALLLIGVGVLLLARNLGGFALDNWWALFILLPAVGAFGSAWRAYQANGQLNAGARASIGAGVLLIMVTAAFVIGLDWTILGPVLIILAGLGVLLNTVLPG